MERTDIAGSLEGMSTPEHGSAEEPLKPVILDGHVDEFTPAPTVPGQMVMLPPSPRHAAVRGGIAAVLAVAGIVNLVFGGMFPYNAPVESIIMFFLSVGMFIGAVVLGVFAVLAAIRRSAPLVPERTSPLAIVGFTLSAAAFAGWVLFNLTVAIGALASGNRLRYMDDTGALLILVVPWILGLVFGAIALRSGGRRTALFAGLAVGLGLLLVVVAVGSSILYGLGLTN